MALGEFSLSLSLSGRVHTRSNNLHAASFVTTIVATLKLYASLYVCVRRFACERVGELARSDSRLRSSPIEPTRRRERGAYKLANRRKTARFHSLATTTTRKKKKKKESTRSHTPLCIRPTQWAVGRRRSYLLNAACL